MKGQTIYNDVEISENVSFRDMMLSEQVLSGLTKCNFTKPSPIQLRAIPIGRCGLDVIIQSKSGTGKTLVFCTIILEKYNVAIKTPQSLIVVPTREIALQVEAYLSSIGSNCTGFSVACVIGGRDIIEDRKRLSKCKAIVGTPGRILHLIKNNVVCTQNIRTFVLDEADKLVSGDFYSDINVVLNAMNKERQIIASSATYSNGLDKSIASLMSNPITVSTNCDTPVLMSIKQFMLPVESFSAPGSSATPVVQAMRNKVAAVEYILSTTSYKQCILFSNSQFRANSYSNYLTQHKWSNELMVGSQDQQTRTATLNKFRQYKSRILVTSDLIARGVDIVNVNLVINMDVPSDSSTYLHRIGRCGRFGRRGLAITLTQDDADMRKFQELLAIIGGSKMKVTKFPTTNCKENMFDVWNCADEADFRESDTLNGAEHTKPRPFRENGKERPNARPKCEAEESSSVENRNINLLEMAKLMINNAPSEQTPIIDVDTDLFSDFQNGTNENGSASEVTADIFEDFESFKCGANSDEAVASESSSKIVQNLEEKPLISSCTESMSPKTDQNIAEPKELHKKIQSKARQRAPTAYCVPKVTSFNDFWSQVYWQQLRDINQFVNSQYQ